MVSSVNDGQPITLFVSLIDSNSALIQDAQSVSYSLYNGKNEAIFEDVSLDTFVGSSTVAEITIPDIHNVLLDGESAASRLVLLSVTDESGRVSIISAPYIVRKRLFIGFMNNSYQSLQDAEMTAYSLPSLSAWGSASNEDKIRALVEAFNRIGKMSFIVKATDDTGEVTGYVKVYDLNLLHPDYVATLPEEFLQALRRAQLVEADTILGGDEATERRESGLMSETVGESSRMWRPGRPLSLPMSKKALNELSGYVLYGTSVGRS